MPEDDVNKLRQKNYENPSESMKCFSACMLEQVGVLKDNKVQEDVAQQKLTTILDEEKAKQVVSKCKGANGDNRCATGYEIFKCVSALKAQILA